MGVARLVPASVALTASEESIGGKALGLARLEAAGARVPSWFAVPTEAFETHLEHAGVTPMLEPLARIGGLRASEQGDALAEAAREIRGAVESQPLDPAVAAELARALEALGPGPFAVRNRS